MLSSRSYRRRCAWVVGPLLSHAGVDDVPVALCDAGSAGMPVRVRSAAHKPCYIWVALLVCYSSTAPFSVVCVFRRVTDHHNLLHDSSLLKKACVRQVVLDKWFPLMYDTSARGCSDCAALHGASGGAGVVRPRTPPTTCMPASMMLRGRQMKSCGDRVPHATPMPLNLSLRPPDRLAARHATPMPSRDRAMPRRLRWRWGVRV